ncbi:DUF4388 domain-containing protein [Pendulispora albinea]|uniref:DUF4388 domain-containing protein n=1 Tax=Pendulispora albinea TaxID=2741071 RepID=A0ABZ2M9P9_9BACT
MSDREDLLRVDVTGTVHPVGRTASQQLRSRAGEWRALPSPKNLIVMRSEEDNAPVLKLAGEIRTPGALCDVVALIAQSSWRGELQVLEDEGWRSLSFDAGKLVSAASTVPSERLGETLYRFGVLTREDLERVILVSNASGKRLGEAAIELDFVTAEELYPMMSRQAEEIFYGALRVGEGMFYFYDRYDEKSLLRRSNLHTASLLMEGARRMDEMRFFREKIPNDSYVPVRSGYLSSGVSSVSSNGSNVVNGGSSSLGLSGRDFSINSATSMHSLGSPSSSSAPSSPGAPSSNSSVNMASSSYLPHVSPEIAPDMSPHISAQWGGHSGVRSISEVPENLAEVYALCDGKLSVAEIGRRIGQLEFEVTRLVFQLMSGGFVQVIAPRPRGPEAIVEAFNPGIMEIHRIVDEVDADGARRGQEFRDGLARFATGGGVYDALFQGAGPLPDGSFRPERVARNLVKIAGDDPDAWLMQLLHEYVGFALFHAGSLLPREVEAGLVNAVTELLKPVRTHENPPQAALQP